MALKRCCCASRRTRCQDCQLRYSCLYVYLFETPLSLEVECQEPRYRSAPHPFVIQIERGVPKTLAVGDSWSFDMTLIGKATAHIPHIIVALENMGMAGMGKGRGRFQLARLTCLDAAGLQTQTIYEEGFLKIPKGCLITVDLQNRPEKRTDATGFRLLFLTPLRMLFQGELSLTPEFHILAGNLLRRIDNLQRFHCKGGNDIPVEDLIEKARAVRLVQNQARWYDWERYSHRQKRKMRLGGLVGEADYEGDFSLFEPYLTVGTWVNAGKGTSFGLGRYVFET